MSDELNSLEEMNPTSITNASISKDINNPIINQPVDKKAKKQLRIHKIQNKARKYKKRARRRLISIFLLCGLLFLSVFYSPIIGKYVAALQQGESIKEVSEDILGRKTIKIKNAILGQTREKQELVVMEQDVSVTSEISSSLANLSVFSKTKTIYSFATGVYTVDMSSINEDNIKVNEQTKTVTVTIPHTSLQYVQLDIDKTQFEQTQKGFLAFGDLKLTQEQQQILNEEVYNTMHDTLDSVELYKKADELALLKVWEIFSPLIEAVSDEYILNVIFPITQVIE